MNCYIKNLNLKYSQKNLLKIAINGYRNKKWELFYNNVQADYFCSCPSSLATQFKSKVWDWCGFACTFSKANILPHEDPGIHPQTGQSDIKYGRSCAIFFPVFGEFNKYPIQFWNKKGHLVDELFLNEPTLVVTKGEVLHSINNKSNLPRVFFCINFNPPKSFTSTIELLKNQGIINDYSPQTSAAYNI